MRLVAIFQRRLFTLLNELHELKISVIATVPNNFMMLLDERLIGRADLGALRHALIAGARFPLALDRQFKRFLPETKIYNCYGPTEATIYCLARVLDGEGKGYVEDGTVSVGVPISGCQALVVNEEMQPLSPLQRGELLIGGIQVMEGYVNNSQATKRALIEIEGACYYRTGDLAFYNEHGDFFITGRNDDTVKVAGQRVNLSDIDGYASRLDLVKSCATIAIEDEVRGSLLVLYVIPSGTAEKNTIAAALREILPKHQIPQDIVIVDSFPVNNSGKICKKTLQDRYVSGRPSARN